MAGGPWERGRLARSCYATGRCGRDARDPRTGTPMMGFVKRGRFEGVAPAFFDAVHSAVGWAKSPALAVKMAPRPAAILPTRTTR